MSKLKRVFFLGVLLLSAAGPSATLGQDVSDRYTALSKTDPDPLRKFLPSSDLFMPVPGGLAAVGRPISPAQTVEEQKGLRNGGLLVGYCLKLSCTRITHLAVLQVCDNRIGGLSGDRELVLGVVKLPYGGRPGFLKALQGRNYATNYFHYGPFETILTDQGLESDSGNYAAFSESMGPVAALEYLGLSVKQIQSSDTITLQVGRVIDRRSGVEFPRFEIRHLCEREYS